MKSSFEDKIKLALENYEADYNPADWEDMQKRLDTTSKNSKITKGIIFSAISALLIAATGLAYYFVSHENQQEYALPEKTNNVSLYQKSLTTSNPENESSINTLSSESIAHTDNEKIQGTEKTQSESKPGNEKLNSSTEMANTSPEQASAKNIADAKEFTESKNERKEPVISSYPSPKGAFHADKNSVCAGSVVQFYLDNSDIPCEYRWDFGDGELSGEPNPKHMYKTPGNYSVKLQVISLLDKKSDVQLMKDMITVNPVPNAEFRWNLIPEEGILFESDNEDIVEWQWNFGDKQSSPEQKPSHQYSKKGNYSVSLLAKNNYGCTGKSQKTVTAVNDFNLLAPNAFSPNGDGKNDSWLPVALLSGDYTFTLTVLDKNGNVAFKTSSANNPWDGRHAKTNDMVKAGDAFKWIAVVKDKNGGESTYGGVISITESSGY